MRAMWLVIVVTLASLGFTSAVVVWGRDSTVLVPPPEAVAEQFARHLAARRYDRALQYVDEASKVSPATVRARGDELHERAGAIDFVEGRPGEIEGEHASAMAILRTEEAGAVTETFTLARRNGVWKIVEWR